MAMLAVIPDAERTTCAGLQEAVGLAGHARHLHSELIEFGKARQVSVQVHGINDSPMIGRMAENKVEGFVLKESAFESASIA